MSDLLSQIRERRNQLSAPGGELSDDDFNSPIPNGLISSGKAAISEITGPGVRNAGPEGFDLLGKINARRAEVQAQPRGLGDQSEKVIAETADGGRVIELEDGTRAFTSPGYSTNDPAKIAEILRGSVSQDGSATPADVSRSGWNKQIIAENPTTARLTKFVEGTPFVGSYLDEGVEAVAGPEAGRAVRATSQAMEEERPVESAALSIGGAVTGSVGLGAAALPRVAPLVPGSPIMRAMLAGVLGTATGATEGAIYGAGEQEGGGRKENAAQGAMWGGAIGGATAGIGAAAADSIERITKRLKKLDLSVIESEFELSKPAAKAVKAALDGEDMDAAVRALRGLGDEAMLADAGPAAGAMLDAVSQTGGQANRITREAVDGRIARMSPKMKTAFNIAFGQPKGTKGAFGDIAQGSAKLREKAYQEAFTSPIDYSKDSGRAIEGVLERIPSNTLTAAIREANEAMQSEGLSNLQILAEIADDGAVTFREMPNVQQLDEIKKALQSIAANETDAITGKVSSKGRRAKILAKDLRDAVQGAVPAYKRAVKLGGDKIGEEQSFQMGQRLFSQSTSVEDVAEIMRDATPASRRAAKEGIRNFLETSMSHVRRTVMDGDTEGREALSAIKALSSRANRDKLVSVVGKENARRVLETVDQTAQAFELRAMVSQNSKTAVRQALQGQVVEMAQPNAIADLASADIGQAAKKVVRTLTGATPDVTEKQKRDMFAEIASALTKKRGAEAERAMDLVRSAMEGQALKDEEALFIARLVNPVALSGDAAGREMLAR